MLLMLLLILLILLILPYLIILVLLRMLLECSSCSSWQDLGQDLETACLPLAWRIVNDSMRTDVCLLYPPFLIALACLHMASVILGKDLRAW